MKILITGSGGLVGSSCSRKFIEQGHTVVGIDNDYRQKLFGQSVQSNIDNLCQLKNYKHYISDIRNDINMSEIIISEKPNVVIHAAAQPSHDWSSKEPLLDYEINSYSTIKLLDICRKNIPECIFIFTSTNKVYGANPNKLEVLENRKRYELPNEHKYYNGIDESMSLDNCIHSPFGASKLSADIIVQEYGLYYKMKTGIFRMGCITGGCHASAELHGFLSYLTKCICKNIPYNIFGYKGLQVRDNIHADDLALAFLEYINNPTCGEVYNMGGGRKNSISILESIDLIEMMAGKVCKYNYIDIPRIGDHIWYITNDNKFKNKYKNWKQNYTIHSIIEELINANKYY